MIETQENTYRINKRDKNSYDGILLVAAGVVIIPVLVTSMLVFVTVSAVIARTNE